MLFRTGLFSEPYAPSEVVFSLRFSAYGLLLEEKKWRGYIFIRSCMTVSNTIEIFSIEEDLTISCECKYYGYYDYSHTVNFIYSYIFNNQINLFGTLSYSVSNSTYILAMLLKLDIESLSDSCSAFSSSYNDVSFSAVYEILNQEFEELLYSTNSSNASLIYSVNSTLNAKYYKSLDVFKDPSVFITYTEINVTDCIWPEYSPLASVCDPILPEFILEINYDMKVGTNLSSINILVPFESCQNTKYFIRVCKDYDGKTCVTPSWISLNQTSSTVIINSQQILSVGSYNLTFETQIVSFTFNESQTQRIISSNNTAIITFTNNNCVLIGSTTEWYLLQGQPKNYTIRFSDDEGDNIYLTAINSKGVNVYIQKINSTAFSLIMNPSDDSSTTSEIDLAYYDRYHQDSSQWNYHNISLNIYASEPPKFSAQIEDIEINKCSTNFFRHLLPSIVDPDSSHFKVMFKDDSPKWIAIVTDTDQAELLKTSNVYITIDIRDIQVESRNYTIDATLVDDSGAFSNYSFIVSIISGDPGSFPAIGNIISTASTSLNTNFEIQGIKNIIAISCDSNKPIDWICYSTSASSLVINNSTVCGSSLSKEYRLYLIGSPNDLCNSKQITGTFCIVLKGIDSCGNNALSRKFNITLELANPPALADSFNVTVYQGHYTEVKLPDQLFISKLGSNLNYTSSNCINQNSINIMTQIRNNTSNSGDNLFIKAFGDNGCVISITSTDSFCQSSEVLVNIEVQKCASKICIECDGPYESNCLKCATNFVLSDSKACLIASSYPLFSSSSIFQICGFINFAIILLHIV